MSLKEVPGGIEVAGRGKTLTTVSYYLAYIALTRASRQLVVSRPLVDQEGKPCDPSDYFVNLAGAFPLAPRRLVKRDVAIEAAYDGQEALAKLADDARRVARGEYELDIQVRSHDEVGSLAREFKQMADALRERERRLIETERVAARSERMAVMGHLAAQKIPQLVGHAIFCGRVRK